MSSDHINGTILVTGANGGLGVKIVQELINSSHPYYGIFTVRNMSPESTGTVRQVVSNTKFPHDIVQLDLGSLGLIRAFAKDINSRILAGTIPKIRALVLNAAVQRLGNLEYTVDGIETVFAVNFLANFLLVLLLLQSMDPERGRIIIISSSVHEPGSGLSALWETNKVLFTDPEIAARPIENDKLGSGLINGLRRYSLSKLLLLMFMYELQSRLDQDPKLCNISIMAVDPGSMPGTGMIRDAPLIVRIIVKLSRYPSALIMPLIDYFFPNGPLRSVNQSARHVLFAMFDEKTLGSHPKAVTLDGIERRPTSAESQDIEKWKEVWVKCLKMVGLKDEETALMKWK